MCKKKGLAEDKDILTGLLASMLSVGLIVVATVVFLLIKQEQLLIRLAVVLLLLLAMIIVVATAIALVSVQMLFHGKGRKGYGAVTGRLVTKLLNNILVPAMAFGKLIGLSRRRIQRAYTHINNRAVYSDKQNFSPGDVLLLLPHCLQNSNCKYRITGSVYNCAGCGRCKIADLVKLGRKTGVKIKVVPGGTLARKVIEEARPKAVVAVACENDLSSGIRDAYPLPVIGVLNKRPHGPCQDTDVDVPEVEKAINFFIDGRE